MILDQCKHFGSASGMIGNPEDSAAQPFAGSMQAFYNSAWQDYAKMMLPPILESNQTTQFVGTEDAYNLNYDFNGSHPFDSNLTWSISHYDSSDESFELNATSGDFQFSPDSNFSGNLTFTIKLEGTHGFTNIIFNQTTMNLIRQYFQIRRLVFALCYGWRRLRFFYTNHRCRW